MPGRVLQKSVSNPVSFGTRVAAPVQPAGAAAAPAAAGSMPGVQSWPMHVFRSSGPVPPAPATHIGPNSIVPTATGGGGPRRPSPFGSVPSAQQPQPLLKRQESIQLSERSAASAYSQGNNHCQPKIVVPSLAKAFSEPPLQVSASTLAKHLQRQDSRGQASPKIELAQQSSGPARFPAPPPVAGTGKEPSLSPFDTPAAGAGGSDPLGGGFSSKPRERPSGDPSGASDVDRQVWVKEEMRLYNEPTSRPLFQTKPVPDRPKIGIAGKGLSTGAGLVPSENSYSAWKNIVVQHVSAGLF